jgi:proteasome lid subunit RPN8/RPN11
MNDHMPQSTEDELITMSMDGGNREICGFIMRNWFIIPIENIALGDREFYMDEQQMLHVYAEHRQDMLGIYHSHPSGNMVPSRKDIEHAPKDLRYWIVSGRGVIEWVIQDGVATSVQADPEVVA